MDVKISCPHCASEHYIRLEIDAPRLADALLEYQRRHGRELVVAGQRRLRPEPTLPDPGRQGERPV